jgi:hypothetical protein
MTRQEEIEKAKQTLTKYGYYTKSLWVTYDVQMSFKCTDEQALQVLDKVFSNENTMETIFDNIQIIGDSMDLKSTTDE